MNAAMNVACVNFVGAVRHIIRQKGYQVVVTFRTMIRDEKGHSIGPGVEFYIDESSPYILSFSAIDSKKIHDSNYIKEIADKIISGEEILQ